MANIGLGRQANTPGMKIFMVGCLVCGEDMELERCRPVPRSDVWRWKTEVKSVKLENQGTREPRRSWRLIRLRRSWWEQGWQWSRTTRKSSHSHRPGSPQWSQGIDKLRVREARESRRQDMTSGRWKIPCGMEINYWCSTWVLSSKHVA